MPCRHLHLQRALRLLLLQLVVVVVVLLLLLPRRWLLGPPGHQQHMPALPLGAGSLLPVQVVRPSSREHQQGFALRLALPAVCP
jgi:hypothetical protein